MPAFANSWKRSTRSWWGGPPAASWDMHLDVEQGSLDVGTPLEHVHGGIRLRGQADGRAWQTFGDLSIDSATWRGIQLTKVQGPLTMDAAGVRGVRFNFVKRLVDTTPHDELVEIATRVAKLGWHVVIYFEAAELPELYDFIASLPATVVVDHMGRPDVTKPVDNPEFALFEKLMADNPQVWSKVTCPDRLSASGPPHYDDFVPFARRLVERFPDRVLWGTDWPHPNLKTHMPDDGALVNIIPRIAPTAALKQQLLVDNPMRLYWPEEYRSKE